MVDNLFLVESPLQALVAVELSLRFKDKKNVIVYRLSDKKRKRNNEQIEKVLKYGVWAETKEISFDNRSAITSHLSIIKALKNLKKNFNHNVNELFIGEFRSQWMHFARVAISPNKTVLMDDGAATVTVKRNFIDKGVYYPAALWEQTSLIKRLVKRHLYRGFLQSRVLQSRLYLASAFIKAESLYPVDFSALKELFKTSEKNIGKKAVFFFGSKYSESGIVSREYELVFLQRVKRFYSSYDCDLVYCAHRDESDEKLDVLRNTLKFKVVMPEAPAEIFLLENNQRILEVSGAYTSILNNAKLILPEVLVRAFQLTPEEIRIEHRENIELVYKHFRREEILVCKLGDRTDGLVTNE